MNRRAYFYMHSAILLWGFTGILGRAINMSFGSIVWFRMLISSIGLLLIIIPTKKFKFISGKDLVGISIIGTIVMVHWIAFYAAIKFSNVSVTLSCFASVSLFTALLDPLINKRRIDRVEIILSLFVLCGIYLIFLAQQVFFWGIVLSLFSAVLGAVFTIYNKRFLYKYDAELITFYELFTGWLVIAIVYFFNFNFLQIDLSIPSARDFVYLLLLSLLCTTLAFTISLKALKELNPFILNLSVNLEPVYSIILAIIIFNENKELNTGFYIGTAIILLSVVIHVLHERSKYKKIISASVVDNSD